MKTTESTATMHRALLHARLLKEKLPTMYGSGLNITIGNYSKEDTNHVDTVTVHVEFCDGLLNNLIYALEESLLRRRDSLVRELNKIDELQLGPPTRP